MSIRYEGCENPLETIEESVAQFESTVADARFGGMSEYLKEIEEGKADGPVPFQLQRAGMTFEEWKDACLAAEAEDKITQAKLNEFLTGKFPDSLGFMPGVIISGPVEEFVVDEVVQEAKKRFGTVLSNEYVAYLKACGAMTVCGVEHTGIVPGSDMDLMEALRETVNDVGVDPKYYPLSLIDSNSVITPMFFQDKDGYVYGLDRQNVLRPVFRSLQEYVAAVWYLSKEGVS